MKVSVHAPPEGSKSGIADYAAVLSAALGRFGKIEANSPNADVHLYHLGNNGLHAQIYERAIAVPGVVVLHDAVLHHFLLGQLSRERYVDEWVYNYGEWRRELGEELWRDRARSGTDPRYFRFAMLRRVVEAAKAVIVHNPGAAELAKAAGAANLVVIPHFFDAGEPIPTAEILDFRTGLGAARATTVFGLFGYLRETKRVMPSLASFFRLREAGADVALLLAGEPVSPDLARLLEAELDRPRLVGSGYLSERDLRLAAASIDCCLNLRHPAAGETSGIAIRLMGAGKVVIGSDIQENSDVPDEAMLKVKVGPSEQEELFSQMSLMARFPEIRQRIGDQAAAHIRKHHAIAAVAARYWTVMEESAKLT